MVSVALCVIPLLTGVRLNINIVLILSSPKSDKFLSNLNVFSDVYIYEKPVNCQLSHSFNGKM